jgi:hypothetical protein
MTRFAIALAFSAGVVFAVAGRPAGGGQSGAKPPILLTQNDLDRVVKVKNGDVIEVRLPVSSLGMKWVLTPDQPVLRPIERVATLDAQPKPTPGPKKDVPSVGAPGNQDQFYQIATDKAVNLRPTWIFCRFGRPELTKKRIDDKVIAPPEPPEFRPGLKPTDLREGMTFHFNLEVTP